jgi:methyl-accepting chemotaxis protein
MSSKDLSEEAKDASKDELGMLAENLNKVIRIMRDFMGKAQDTATSLADVETTLTGNATELQSSSGIIVDNTKDIARRVKELDKNIGTSVEAAKQVDSVLAAFIGLAESQADNLGRISTAVEEMAASMNNVTKLVESRLGNLQELQSAIQLGFDEADKSSDILARAKHELEGISEISDMIADVADKTNILSMNAAIESAHAGTSGKGFAVVAEEIRKLSDTASENASNIEKLVKIIAVSLNNSSASAVQSREVLAATKTTVDTFVAAFSEIGSSTRELSQATKEILEAVSNINASSLTIKQEGSKAAQWSRKIEGDMELVGITSEQVVKRVESIQENIDILSKALAHMNSLVETTSMRSSELDAMLCEFKIEQACETAPEVMEPKVAEPTDDAATEGTV